MYILLSSIIYYINENVCFLSNKVYHFIVQQFSLISILNSSIILSLIVHISV